jgi:asparagine synthase (glutamine-hydrolysing)
MCGIAGYITNNLGTLDQSVLKKMTDAVAHRGPDGEGFWFEPDSGVALGHRRLSIIDLSEIASQPMHYLDRYVIIFNGEIYNYKEIRETLLEKRYNFKSESDTEVLVALYDHKKEECLNDLDGMFAFVIYDRKEKVIFCARDRFGEKPFYYSFFNDSFYFGSVMRCIWEAGIPRQWNEKMFANYLYTGTLSNPGQPDETFFKNIYKLPPAHYIKLNTADLTMVVKKYWHIDINKTADGNEETEIINQLKQLLLTSVNRRLRSDVPVGSSLSGGLDSSIVVALIDKIDAERNIHRKTFSACFPGFKKDEKEFQDIVIANTHVEPHFVQPSGSSMLHNLPEIILHQEEPFSSPSICAQYEVFQLARDQGVTVLLDGQGADEILAGYHGYYHAYFDELEKNGKQKYKEQLRKYADLHSGNDINKVQGRSKYGRIKELMPRKTFEAVRRYRSLKKLDTPVINKEFGNDYLKYLFLPQENFQSLNAALYYSTFSYGLEDLLRFADRNSMAHSREVRLPFLYHELVSFLFSLPSRYKINDGWTKWILRATFSDLLPAEIIWRKEKIGYEPLFEWDDTEFLSLGNDAIQALKQKNILNKEVTLQNVFSKDEKLGWRIFNASLLM